MSLDYEHIAVDRILNATEESPITVFRTDDEHVFRTVFTNTVATGIDAKINKEHHLGSFYGPQGSVNFRRASYKNEE
tara:strand:+ start:1483 stop:1713 length:231 start_codon:yes stop_codon:yes gene_type:complete